MIAEDHILFSPFATLRASVQASAHVPEHITLHDLLDAYSSLTCELKSRLTRSETIDANKLGFPSAQTQISELISAVRRDIWRISYGPAFESHSNGITERELQFARDTAMLNHHALSFVAVLLAFPDFETLVSGAFTHQSCKPLLTFNEAKHLDSLLDDILAILLTQSLPTLTPSRTFGLLFWILQVQRLKVTIVAQHQEKIVRVAGLAINGYYAPSTIIDGLRLMAAYLRKPLREIQSGFLRHFEKSLSLLTSASPHERFHAANVLSGFAYARINDNIDPESTLIFVKKLKAFFRAQSDPMSRLLDLLRQALVVGEKSSVAGPKWAISVITSVIVLMDNAALTEPLWTKTIVGLLEGTATTSPSNALFPLAWNCLIWSFSKAKNCGEHGGFEIIRRAPRRGCGSALVSVLLRSIQGPETASNDPTLSKVCDIVKEMAVTKDKGLRKDGIELLAWLLSEVGNSTPEQPEDQYPFFLLHRALFDGAFLNTEQISSDEDAPWLEPVGPRVVRRLTELEIEKGWEDWYNVWFMSLMAALRDPEPVIQKAYIDIWQYLLLSETQLSQQQGDLTAPVQYVDHARDTIVRFTKVKLQPQREVVQLQLLQELWRTLYNVFTPTNLGEVSKDILNAVVKHSYCIEDKSVLSQWIMLCDALALNRTPQKSERETLRTESWISLAQVFHEVGQSPARSIAFLRLPLTLSFGDVDYLRWWDVLLHRAVTAHQKASENIPLTSHALWRYIWPEECHWPLSHPELLYRIFLLQVNSDTFNGNLPIEDQKLLADVMTELHPPEDPDTVDIALKYFVVMDKIVSAIPVDSLLPALSFFSPSLVPWIKDEGRHIPDNLYTKHVVPLYCKIIQRIDSLEVSLDTFSRLESLLLSPILRCPRPGLATEAFIDFWAAKYDPLTKDSHLSYSGELREKLRCLDIVFNTEFAIEWSQTTNSQVVDDSFIVPESIPIPSPERPEPAREPQPPVATHDVPNTENLPPLSSRKRKVDEESIASGSTATRRKRKAMVLDCVQLPSVRRSTQGTKRSRESQLITPEASRASSASPFRVRLLAEPEPEPPNDEEDGDDYDWESGHVSIGDLADVIGDDTALEQSSEKDYGDGTESRPTKRRRHEDQNSDPVELPPSMRSKPSSSMRKELVLKGLIKRFQEEQFPMEELFEAQKDATTLLAVINGALKKKVNGSGDPR
ncbi:hypothetical protein V5O48_000864 [Marasmius crinis-equi]|uniref:Telomere-associated protein Rif1 N-terminal domain-containing protein n=1 Tax=Marasmius crinis-equi TaxID=585013 RepID=A0ABR3G049_9AGAR